jgi:response regulator RpfG family c-di-GMP phosphodiesterase
MPLRSRIMTNILIIDDEEPIRNLLRRILEGKGYSCVLAASGEEGRERLKERHYELVLCDIRMPGESGLDFVRYALSECPDIAAVMVTGVDDPLVAGEALLIGVYDYLVKPLQPNAVIITVANALRRRELELADRAHREDLEKIVVDRTATLQSTTEKLRKALDGTVHALALTVEMRDPYTAGHQRRVADLVSAMGKRLGLSSDRTEGIRMAGIVHDLGKISVPTAILNKPGRLTKNEFNLIKDHSQVGYDILKDIEFPWPIAQMVLQHHERMDGSGYPGGLSGQEILLEARMLAVADVVEAMASHRPYRPALGIDKALDEISRNRGVFYDPEVVDTCLALFKEEGFKL